MQVLITRPREDAEALAATLAARGHGWLIEPMLRIEPLPDAAPALEGVQALLLTSAHAVPALTAAACRLPVYAVGSATAAAARRAGAARVIEGGGDAARLAALVIAACRPDAGALLHLAGAETRPGLAERLRPAGFDFRRQVVYRALPAAALSPPLRQALAAGALDAVLLFSPRTAAIFTRLIAAAGLAERLRGVHGLCLSRAVAAAADLPWRSVKIALRHDSDALLDQLDACR